MPHFHSSHAARRLTFLAVFGWVTLGLAAGACARTWPDSFAPLVKKLIPTVVNIAVTETVAGSDPLAGLPPELQRQFRDRVRRRSQQVAGAGSGFIIDPSGVIVTNNHVVGNADKIVVALSDGTELPAKLLGADELTDVAVIKVSSPTPLSAATWGDSKAMEVGDWVIAAGNPFALGGSVTAGIVSARGRDIGAGLFDDFIQIDAPINPGNSGGPLFNEDGQVVGMNSAIYSPTGGSVGIGFAIPSELVSRIVAELREKGHIDRGWLGVSVQDLPDGTRKPTGVAIAAVDRSGPAARSGLKPGDIVTMLNGQAMSTARGLTRAVALTPPGNTVQLSVRRQGRDLDLSVTVGHRPKIEEN
jgi:serine protease Do